MINTAGAALKYLLPGTLALVLAACSSVTIRPYGGEKDTSVPDYQASRPFYLMALIGEHEVNTSAICGEHRVMQMQALTSLSDWLLTIGSLTIYTPRTVKVWCDKPRAAVLLPVGEVGQ